MKCFILSLILFSYGFSFAQASFHLQANTITTSSVELVWEPSHDAVTVNTYIIEQDNIDIAQISSENLSYTVSELSPETLYNFRIYGVDTSGHISEPSDNFEVVTLAESNVLFFEDFENCDLGLNNFKSLRERSNTNWECKAHSGENDTQAYQLNAYQDGQQTAGIDWLISSDKINFDNYEIEKISFWTSAKHGNIKLELLYSSTYDGKGSPSNFQWQEIPNLSIPLHPEANSSLFVFKANTIDISEITGEVYIAFRHSTPYGKKATQWTVDNFMITGEHLLSSYQFSKQPKVLLHPNPAENFKIHLNFNKHGLKTIEIYNVFGKRLLSTRTYQKKYIQNLSQFPSETYFVRVEQNGNSIVKRFILN